MSSYHGATFSSNGSLADAVELLAQAGITIGGADADVIVYRPEQFLNALATLSTLELARSFMRMDWNAEHLDQVIERVMRTFPPGSSNRRPEISNATLFRLIKRMIINKVFPSRLADDAKRHYNISPKLYERMLDNMGVYTCGFWFAASTLEEAQLAKLDRILRKAQAKDGDNFLFIGCGSGGELWYFATHYPNSKIVGITVSEDQHEAALRRCAGLLNVEIRLQDYRDLPDDEVYDRIITIGALEHLGHLNYRGYFNSVREHLTEQGIHILHTIGCPTTTIGMDDFIHEYIFPGEAEIPSMAQITAACEHAGLELRDMENIDGRHYDRTLMEWFSRFSHNWPEIKESFNFQTEEEATSFYQMWKFYLQSCAASFRVGNMCIFHCVFTRKNSGVNYVSVR